MGDLDQLYPLLCSALCHVTGLCLPLITYGECHLGIYGMSLFPSYCNHQKYFITTLVLLVFASQFLSSRVVYVLVLLNPIFISQCHVVNPRQSGIASENLLLVHREQCGAISWAPNCPTISLKDFRVRSWSRKVLGREVLLASKKIEQRSGLSSRRLPAFVLI